MPGELTRLGPHLRRQVHRMAAMTDLPPVTFDVTTGPDGLFLETRGLVSHLGRELRAAVLEEHALSDAKGVMLLAAEQYVSKPSRSNVWWSSTGFRMLKWTAAGGRYQAEERDGSSTRRNIQRAATEWGAQKVVCAKHQAPFDPIAEDSLIAIAPAALRSGAAVEGTRYVMTPPNSGWILVDEHFTGGVNDLRIEHALHVAESRPDLVRYFGLPPGWRFLATKEGDLVDSGHLEEPS